MEDACFGLLWIILEPVLDGIFEYLIAEGLGLIWRALGEIFKTSEIKNPVVAFIGYWLLGTVTGAFSLFIFRHPLVHPSRIHGISLLVSPLITGCLMSLTRAILRKQEKTAIQLESFGYGFAFAFGMALMRFFFAK
jgi:hypothetical protein